jgi:acetyl-CoA/propionyl-CoA carboxylase biotin carboxyl carrier protein
LPCRLGKDTTAQLRIRYLKEEGIRLAQRFRITIGAKSYDVEVGDPTESPLTVVVDGETFLVDVQPTSSPDAVLPEVAEPNGEPTRLYGRAVPRPAADVAAGACEVMAPMPGTILDLAVEVGDAVQPGHLLCALEAMKMKSPIRSPRGGTIRQVGVQDGQSVEHGDLLFVVG